MTSLAWGAMVSGEWVSWVGSGLCSGPASSWDGSLDHRKLHFTVAQQVLTMAVGLGRDHLFPFYRKETEGQIVKANPPRFPRQ